MQKIKHASQHALQASHFSSKINEWVSVFYINDFITNAIHGIIDSREVHIVVLEKGHLTNDLISFFFTYMEIWDEGDRDLDKLEKLRHCDLSCHT